jgi:hypothetical protein
MARAVFVDKRDMPQKLYPFQFRVTGTFVRTMNGEEVPMELHVELTNQEARQAQAHSHLQQTLLAVVRDEVLVAVNRAFSAERIPQKIIDQIDGKEPCVDPPQKE